MLDKQDLQAIKELIDGSVTASEARTQAKLDAMGAKIDATENRIMAYIESAVMPKFQILADGHQNILDTLAPKSRVEALEEEVIFLKSIVKTLAQDMAEMKKAQ